MPSREKRAEQPEAIRAAAHRTGYEAATKALDEEAKRLRDKATQEWKRKDREQSDYTSRQAAAIEDAADMLRDGYEAAP